MNSVSVWTSIYFYLSSSKSEVNHFNVNYSDTSLRRKKSDLDTDFCMAFANETSSVIVYTFTK